MYIPFETGFFKEKMLQNFFPWKVPIFRILSYSLINVLVVVQNMPKQKHE